eukprot:NODE_8618_length_402_cov_35.252125_g7738_i0.p2 GENE.NODE_8618_length_402_cov_35.252125_g7738_i0~~NODE_8618_length_402_cov_35.252125_g7738_i0.p2  ORF type:complete len:104 (-),score=33.87 NODE_8618_length_402_cov_35.252125_g7738_i0:90-356(-)
MRNGVMASEDAVAYHIVEGDLQMWSASQKPLDPPAAFGRTAALFGRQWEGCTARTASRCLLLRLGLSDLRTVSKDYPQCHAALWGVED